MASSDGQRFETAQPYQQVHLRATGRSPPDHPGVHPDRRVLAELAGGGWGRIFRKTALAGQSFADPDDIDHATQVAPAQLNARAKPWIWERPRPPTRTRRRRYVYCL